MKIDLETFLANYVEAALWSTNDESTPQGGEPMDKNYDIEDIDEETLEKMREDCRKFIEANEADLLTWEHPQYSVEEMGGHDFWLTRNHHGSGFWDGDWKKAVGERLTAASDAFGEMDLYVGDDGKIHS